MSERAGVERRSRMGGKRCRSETAGNAVAGAHLSLMASRPALACLPASARSARIFCARTSAVCPKGRCSTIAPARQDLSRVGEFWSFYRKRLSFFLLCFCQTVYSYINQFRFFETGSHIRIVVFSRNNTRRFSSGTPHAAAPHRKARRRRQRYAREGSGSDGARHGRKDASARRGRG